MQKGFRTRSTCCLRLCIRRKDFRDKKLPVRSKHNNTAICKTVRSTIVTRYMLPYLLSYSRLIAAAGVLITVPRALFPRRGCFSAIMNVSSLPFTVRRSAALVLLSLASPLCLVWYITDQPPEANL